MTSNLATHVEGADALILVPPFGGLDRPALGAHVLQACARTRGFEVKVLYANMLLARAIGELEYSQICFASTSNLLGERYFAAAAYGAAPGVSNGDREAAAERRPEKPSHVPPMGWEAFAALAAAAGAWADALTEEIAECCPRVVGCTTTFEQTAASVALLERLRRLRPELLLLLGGANCEGEMAEGILTLTPEVDHVFSGESEGTFPAFLAELQRGDRPASRIIQGSPCRDLDALPTPDFSAYYDQLAEFLPDSRLKASGAIWLPYESSRGCWWGEKSHCTFCGINGGGMVFRQKSADKVLTELRELLSRHPTRNVCMVDNIMPHNYFTTLLPRMAEADLDAHLFYEQKANLSFDRVERLKKAGVAVIQPGIEALSTPLLGLMRKGVSASQNVALLRYARMVDLAVNWNLLYAFPQDRLEWYEATSALLPLLAHLNPPTGVCHLSIDRFSPYFDRPGDFAIRSIRPMAPYAEILPPGADVPRIAYHFEGDYPSESKEHPERIAALEKEVEAWRERWRPEASALPVLEIASMGDGAFLLVDTRGLEGCLEFEFIDRDQTLAALFGPGRHTTGEAEEWAGKRKALIEIDGRAVPLATAPPELFRELQVCAGAGALQRRTSPVSHLRLVDGREGAGGEPLGEAP